MFVCPPILRRNDICKVLDFAVFSDRTIYRMSRLTTLVPENLWDVDVERTHTLFEKSDVGGGEWWSISTCNFMRGSGGWDRTPVAPLLADVRSRPTEEL